MESSDKLNDEYELILEYVEWRGLDPDGFYFYWKTARYTDGSEWTYLEMLGQGLEPDEVHPEVLLGVPGKKADLLAAITFDMWAE